MFLHSSERRQRRKRVRHKTAVRRRLMVEPLEERTLLAVNLSILDAYIVNGQLERIETPVLGEQVFVLVTYRTENLPQDAAHRIDFAVDGWVRSLSLIHI